MPKQSKGFTVWLIRTLFLATESHCLVLTLFRSIECKSYTQKGNYFFFKEFIGDLN